MTKYEILLTIGGKIDNLRAITIGLSKFQQLSKWLKHVVQHRLNESLNPEFLYIKFWNINKELFTN